MIKRFLVAIVAVLGLILPFEAEAQHRELSIEAAYPLPIGDTFLSQYNGRAGASVMLGQSITDDLVIRIGMQYNRLYWDPAGTTANVYTPRAGLRYILPISRRVRVNPEAGFSYSRFSYRSDLSPSSGLSGHNGLGVWIGISPQLMIGAKWAIGLATEYRATRLLVDDEFDIPFNREYHAFVVGIVGTYRF